MKTNLFCLLVGLSYCSLGHSSLPQILKFQEAQVLEKNQPDKSCLLYTQLSEQNDFILQDLADIKQSLVCNTPKPLKQNYSAEKPWLSPLQLESEIKMARLEQKPLSLIESAAKKAKLQKSQGQSLEVLEETKKILQKFSNSPEEIKTAETRLLQIKEEIAPRFKTTALPEQELKVSQDFLNAREFEKARVWADKVIKRKSASFDDQVSARKIKRNSYKLEQNKKMFLSLMLQDWIWAKSQSKTKLYVDLGLLYARALWTEDQADKARQILVKIEKLASGSAFTEIAFIRGKMLEEKKNYKEALVQFQKPRLDLKSNLDRKVQFAKAWCAWKLQNYQLMITELTAVLDMSEPDPFELARALYWKSRAEQKLSLTEAREKTLQELILKDPLGFYGTLGYQALNKAYPPLQAPNTKPEFKASTLYSSDYLQALLDVKETTLLQDAIREVLKKINADSPAEDWLPVFLAAAKANLYLPLFSQISQLTPENRNLLLVQDPELIFPIDYQELILANAKKFEVSPELIFSIIRQESAFNPLARSSADAFGLMQLLPSISQNYKKQVGIEVKNHEDLYKPEVNIPYGAKLLKDLMQKYNGRIYLAAAAYNASEKSLQTWLKMRWNNDVVEFIEEIPFEETRTYVKLITRNYVFYSRLLHPKEPTRFPEVLLKVAE